MGETISDSLLSLLPADVCWVLLATGVLVAAWLLRDRPARALALPAYCLGALSFALCAHGPPAPLSTIFGILCWIFVMVVFTSPPDQPNT